MGVNLPQFFFAAAQNSSPQWPTAAILSGIAAWLALAIAGWREVGAWNKDRFEVLRSEAAESVREMCKCCSELAAGIELHLTGNPTETTADHIYSLDRKARLQLECVRRRIDPRSAQLLSNYKTFWNTISDSPFPRTEASPPLSLNSAEGRRLSMAIEQIYRELDRLLMDVLRQKIDLH